MNDTGLSSDGICRAIDQLTVSRGYACFAARLVGIDDPRPSVSGDPLLDPSMRTAIEARFAQRLDNFDPRAVHSIRMKWYLDAFLPPVLLADLLLMRTLPVSLAGTRFIIGDDMRVAAIKISGAGEDTTNADPFDVSRG